MGGGSKKQTVGYKYYLGMHMILCHGPIDRFTGIKVDNRQAWAGNLPFGQIYVNAENLFGGESREGGVSGYVDLENGRPDQGFNDYLVAKCGTLVPAYRGVAGVVLRQCYLGVNPYLKRWGFRGTRILTRQDGITQWYPAKAPISTFSSGVASDTSLYIALDTSGSMAGSKLDVLKLAMGIVFDQLETYIASGASSVNIRIVGWGSSATSITKMNVTTEDFTDLRAFVNGLSASGGTDAVAAYSGALDFFNPSVPYNYVCCCVSDGAMSNVSTALSMGMADMVDTENDPYSTASGTAVKMRGIGIATAGSLDNFDNSGEPVPVVTGDNAGDLAQVILDALYTQVPTGDMNPVHIIRECLTDPDWGMGYLEAEIDDVAFTAAADTLWAEGMGMSLLWDRQVPIEDFIKEVVKHIDATLYVDRRTGLFKLKLIRNDYTLDSLIHLNPDNIDKVTDFSRPAFAELTNSVTVNYWDSLTGTTASKTIQDIALAQMQGATINTTLQYPGFTNANIATRAAQRDMTTLSSPLASCTIYTNRVADDLNIGDTFLFTWPDYEVYDLPMRVTGAAYGNGKSNRIRLTCTQDRFATPTDPLIPEIPPEWENPDQPPVPLTRQLAMETPYYELVQQQTQTVVDQAIAGLPELGYVMAAASRPNQGTLNARFYSDPGTGYEDVGVVDFGGSAILDQDIGLMDTSFSVRDEVDTTDVEAESWLLIGEEIMGVVSLTGGILTVKRACLDTVPASHLNGDTIHFCDAFAELDPTEYVQGDNVNVKLAPVTGQGELPLGSATALPVAVAGRPVRPYPPGNVRVNGSYYPTLPLASINLTWAERNRLQQTAGALIGFTDGTLTPEVGTTYHVTLHDDVGTLIGDYDGITGTSFSVPGDDIPVGSDFCVIRLWSERDGFESLFQHVIQLNLFQNTGENLQFVMDVFDTPPDGDSLNFVMDE